ncbi:MAG TPA: TIGR01841 family phasin [Azospirillum sp.]|nr:TIGR01841 family phasin [Azospirillum sp.]
MNDKIAAAQKVFEDVVGQTKQSLEGYAKAQQEQLQKASAQLLKGYEELNALTKGNVEAVVQSGTIVAKGAEEAGKQVAAFTQSSLEQSLAIGKSAMAVKSIRELVDLQNSYLKASLDALVAESTKLQQLSIKVTNEALAPLNARVNVAVEKLSKPLAA